MKEHDTWDEGRLKIKITWTKGSPVILIMNAVEWMLKEKLIITTQIYWRLKNTQFEYSHYIGGIKDWERGECLRKAHKNTHVTLEN